MGWMSGDADWVHPSQRTPEGKAEWEQALAEVRHVSEMHDRYNEFIASQELACEEARHYGVYHPDRGWLVDRDGRLIVETSKAVAEAQADIARWQRSDVFNANLYRVRCIEEWAEEGHDDG